MSFYFERKIKIEKEYKILSSSMIISGLWFGSVFRLLMNNIINENYESYNFHTALVVIIGIGFGGQIGIKMLEIINKKNSSQSLLNEQTPLLSKNEENNFESSYINSLDLQNQPSTTTGIYHL